MRKTSSNFIRFLGYVRPFSGYLVLAVIGGIVKFTVPLLVPQVTRYLLDDVFLSQTLTATQKYHELFVYGGGMIAVFAIIYSLFVYIRHLFDEATSSLDSESSISTGKLIH